MPLLSIVTTVYDRAACLAICLRSAANLDWQDYEHIVVADHPPEDSLEALRRVVDEAADPRVRLYNLPARTNDLGISPAQFGVQQARGKYLAFLDDDNGYLPSHFNALIDCLEKHPELGLAYSAGLWDAQLLLNSPTPAEGRIDLGQVLFRRSVFQAHLNDELKYSGYTWDWQLISDLLSRGVAFRFIDQETFVFRLAQYPALQPEGPLESARKRIDELARAAQFARREFNEASGQAQDEIVRLRMLSERLQQQARASAGAQEELERVKAHAGRLERWAAELTGANRGAHEEIDRLGAHRAELERWARELAEAHRNAQQDIARLTADNGRLAREVALREVEGSRLAATITGLEARLGAVQHELRQLRESGSWRITAPLRRLLDLLAGRRP